MKWIKFSERWPKLEMFDEILVRTIISSCPECETEESGKTIPEGITHHCESNQQERRAARTYLGFILSDCIHPLQNCYFDIQSSEWLED